MLIPINTGATGIVKSEEVLAILQVEIQDKPGEFQTLVFIKGGNGPLKSDLLPEVLGDFVNYANESHDLLVGDGIKKMAADTKINNDAAIVKGENHDG